MFKRTKSFSKQAKNLLKSKKGFFVDTGVKVLIAVVVGALMLSSLYVLFNTTVMPNVKSKVEELFNYSESGGAGPVEEDLEEKYSFDLCIDAYNTWDHSDIFGIWVDNSKLKRIEIDDQKLNSDEYELSDTDGTYFYITKNGLNKLDKGNHTIKAVFDDGYALSTFKYVFVINFKVENYITSSAGEGDTFADWLENSYLEADTNYLVWRKTGDEKVYINDSYTQYITGVTWDTVIEDNKTYAVSNT